MYGGKIEGVRLSRVRGFIVLLFVLVHVASGVVSALGACCGEDVHASSTGPLMECCLKGGPNHICPFMAKRKSSKVPLGKVDATCGAGHDNGVPMTGFAGLPEAPDAMVLPEQIAVAFDRHVDSAIVRVVHPLTPPPKA